MGSAYTSPHAFLEQTLVYHERLYHIALARLQDTEEARDALHDVLLKAAARCHQFKNESQVYTWLVRILLNHCHDIHRSKKRHQQRVLPSGDATEKQLQQVVAPNSDIAKKYELSEESRRLISVVGRLDNIYQEVILLHYFEEMSYQQIAETLSLSEGTVKSRLNQARKILRHELEAAGFGGSSHD